MANREPFRVSVPTFFVPSLLARMAPALLAPWAFLYSAGLALAEVPPEPPPCPPVAFGPVAVEPIVKPDAVKPGAPKPAANKDIILDPVRLVVDAPDGLILVATYYPGKKDEETVPIILLHGYEGSRGDYDKLATFLQEAPRRHSVLVPDLRGHGESTKYRNQPEGVAPKPLEAKTLTWIDFAAMTTDIDSWKERLLERNNRKELNIELLTVVGADIGGIVAMNWMARDWSRPPRPGFKVGEDVKSLVLLSPKSSHKMFDYKAALHSPVMMNDVGVPISVLITAGLKGEAYKEAEKLSKQLRPFFPDPREPKELVEKRTLFFVPQNTPLQGTELLDPRLKTTEAIARFIELRVIDKRHWYPWAKR